MHMQETNLQQGRRGVLINNEAERKAEHQF